jgi:hypothetical protein
VQNPYCADVTSPPAGWYEDPSASGDERWWDGNGWTARTRPPALSFATWRGWLTRSPQAQTIGRSIALAAAVGALGALLIGLLALLRDRPLHGLTILLLPAVPLLAAGQLWTIALMNARTPPPEGGWRDRLRAARALQRLPTRTFFFGELDVRIARPLMAVALLGWLGAMTAWPSLVHGGPTGPGDGCRYRLFSHGSYTCVTAHTYEHVGAGEQRFASGILLVFFAVHTGAALGGLRRKGSA